VTQEHEQSQLTDNIHISLYVQNDLKSEITAQQTGNPQNPMNLKIIISLTPLESGCLRNIRNLYFELFAPFVLQKVQKVQNPYSEKSELSAFSVRSGC